MDVHPTPRSPEIPRRSVSADDRFWTGQPSQWPRAPCFEMLLRLFGQAVQRQSRRAMPARALKVWKSARGAFARGCGDGRAWIVRAVPSRSRLRPPRSQNAMLGVKAARRERDQRHAVGIPPLLISGSSILSVSMQTAACLPTFRRDGWSFDAALPSPIPCSFTLTEGFPWGPRAARPSARHDAFGRLFPRRARFSFGTVRIRVRVKSSFTSGFNRPENDSDGNNTVRAEVDMSVLPQRAPPDAPPLPKVSRSAGNLNFHVGRSHTHLTRWTRGAGRLAASA